MRVYEELFILRPAVTDEETDSVVENLRRIITDAGGTLDKTDKWGIRKLAYRIKKENEGLYMLLQFTAGPESVREIERRLRNIDLVLKFITVRIDVKMKRIDKRKKQREKRAARKPAVAAPAPSAPAVPFMPSEPAGPVPGAPMPGAPVAADKG